MLRLSTGTDAKEGISTGGYMAHETHDCGSLKPYRREFVIGHTPSGFVGREIKELVQSGEFDQYVEDMHREGLWFVGTIGRPALMLFEKI